MYVYAGTLLANRWKKAEGLKLAAQSSYEELTSSLPCTYAYIASVFLPSYNYWNGKQIIRKLGLGPIKLLMSGVLIILMYIETVTEDNVKQWVEEDRVLISSCVVANSGQADWKITYVQLLHTLCTEDLSTLQYIRWLASMSILCTFTKL